MNKNLELLENKNFKIRLDELKEKYFGKKVLLYGAGSFFDVIYKNYDLSGFDVVAISDKKFSEIGEYSSYKAIPPIEILNIDFDVIIISLKDVALAENFFEKELISKRNNFNYEPIINLNQFDLREDIDFMYYKTQKELDKNHKLNSLYEDGLLRIRITNKCNAKCKFCAMHYLSSETKNLAVSEKFLYRYLVPIYEKTKFLLLTGGDPLVSKESFNFVEFISENYPQITLMIESNGIGFIDKWQNLGVKNLLRTHFSLNASNVDTYYRGVWTEEVGKIAYEKTTQNMKSYLMKLKEQNLGVFAPSASMVINKDTVSDLKNFLKMALELSFSFAIFYFDCEKDLGSDYFLQDEKYVNALKELIKLERVLSKKFFVFFRLFAPFKNLEKFQKEIDAIPIEQLREEYADILKLAENRDMRREFEERQKIRREQGKKELSFDEDFAVSVRQINFDGKKICAAPWHELDLHPDGRIDFCGWFIPTLNINDFINKETDSIDWESILNSREYKNCRNNLLKGDYAGCFDSCPLNPSQKAVFDPHEYGFNRKTP